MLDQQLAEVLRAALDVASHIVSDERLGEPESNRQLFELLVENGWAPSRMAQPLAQMVGFRNVLVHGYQDVDKAVIRDVLENHLDDLVAYAATTCLPEIRGRVVTLRPR
jgi:uncharacterized protein YutE (UPF0331/DUF86 family)